jgi:hypothetical protein
MPKSAPRWVSTISEASERVGPFADDFLDFVGEVRKSLLDEIHIFAEFGASILGLPREIVAGSTRLEGHRRNQPSEKVGPLRQGRSAREPNLIVSINNVENFSGVARAVSGQSAVHSQASLTKHSLNLEDARQLR